MADMKDIILQCACCHKEITDLSAAGWRNGERRSFECPECGCRTKVEAEVWLRLSSDAEETWRELYRLAQWNACETWFDSDGALRVGGRGRLVHGDGSPSGLTFEVVVDDATDLPCMAVTDGGETVRASILGLTMRGWRFAKEDRS